MRLIFDQAMIAEEHDKAITGQFSRPLPALRLLEEVAIYAVMMLAKKVVERLPLAELEGLEGVDELGLVMQVIHRQDV